MLINTIVTTMQEARGTNTGSPEVLSMAMRWLETCLASHDGCKSSSDIELPTRLLEVDGEIV